MRTDAVRLRSRNIIYASIAMVLVGAIDVRAQQPATSAADVTALVKQTQNPVGDLVSVPLQFNPRRPPWCRPPCWWLF